MFRTAHGKTLERITYSVNLKNPLEVFWHFPKQLRTRAACNIKRCFGCLFRDGNGSVDHGQMAHHFGWVTWVVVDPW